MGNKFANTITITTQCSGGCSHCPFSHPNLPREHLKINTINSLFNSNKTPLVVISGGEPFEHPDISEILDNLKNQTTPFRIATGGFTDLALWIEKLQSLAKPRGFLEGISMGTDVLSTLSNHKKWVSIWVNNIKLFKEYKIPYSITFTLENNLKFEKIDLEALKNCLEIKPQFIYLRFFDKNLVREDIEKIIDLFDNTQILEDKIGPIQQ
ncbi:radical SAM protein [Parachlamydia acanthamoebae]|uniref:radical SAM protein n=1 Tax=Parachlamydia acanthamoebae TaxID=83552 RepID=UPI000751100F|nr:radical SAM protein [Parachlamydia acanthamoebae]